MLGCLLSRMSIFTGELLLRNILPSFEETPLPSLDMSRSWDGIFDMAGSSRRNLRFGGRWSSVTARHGGFRDASVIVMPLERAGLFSATVPPHRGRLLITFWANEAVDRARVTKCSRHRSASRWRLRFLVALTQAALIESSGSAKAKSLVGQSPLPILAPYSIRGRPRPRGRK